jgi:hypothetical protein
MNEEQFEALIEFFHSLMAVTEARINNEERERLASLMRLSDEAELFARQLIVALPQG